MRKGGKHSALVEGKSTNCTVLRPVPDVAAVDRAFNCPLTLTHPNFCTSEPCLCSPCLQQSELNSHVKNQHGVLSKTKGEEGRDGRDDWYNTTATGSAPCRLCDKTLLVVVSFHGPTGLRPPCAGQVKPDGAGCSDVAHHHHAWAVWEQEEQPEYK
jgi:hypothetical protein